MVSIQHRDSDGNPYVRYLYWNDGRWQWNWNWLENVWNVQNPAALLANLFVSLLTFCWESFCLKT
jgi:hypothetical protein